MKNLTQKLSRRFFGAAMQVVTLTLFMVAVGTSAALAQDRAYVTNLGDDTVSVIEPATNTVVATIPVGSTPQGIAVTPNGAFVYVANSNGNVSVISAATETVVATVPVGSTATGVAITPSGAFAYVTSALDDKVSVIDTTTNTLTATIPGLAEPIFIAITPNGALAFVTEAFGTVTVIDTATNTVAATIPTQGFPEGVAITPNGIFAYVSSPLEKLDIRQHARLHFTAAAEIRVKNEMDTDAKAFIGPAPSAPGLTASEIIILCEGADDGGDLASTAVQIGERNTVIANIYAPNGTVFLRANTVATGAFIGKRVEIGQRVELTLKSAF